MPETDEEIVGRVALSFAQALAAGSFDAAHGLLADALQVVWPPARLKAAFTSMVEYGDGPPDQVELIQTDAMDGWPARREADIGWAYVAIIGDGFNEAVSVIVAVEGGRHVIRDVAWGRP